MPLFLAGDTANASPAANLLTAPHDEGFWTGFRQRFHLDPSFVDLRCNAASSLPKATLDELTGHLEQVQALPSLRNHGPAEGAAEPVRAQIAALLNADIGEVALMRNTTEALNNAIMGFPFVAGDEVVAATHEYDNMIASLHQQELRLGLKIRHVDVPYRPASAEEVVQCFRGAITPKTKMFLVSHMVWISGQIYPIKEICALAQQHGIFTVIDAAQSFSHIPVDVRDIDCDYLGASLHKWAAGPLGSGFLYVRRECIKMTLPLLGSYAYSPRDEAIEKFENFGTITPVFRAASASMALWDELGHDVKRQRMLFLKEYWVERLARQPRVEILTNPTEEHSCGIVFFQLKGQSSKAVSRELRDRYRIITQAIENYKNQYVNYEGVNAVGVATSVFNTPTELDSFCTAVEEIAR